MNSDFRVVVIGDGVMASSLATRIETFCSDAQVLFLADPETSEQPVASWLTKVSAEVERADWIIVAIHKNLPTAKNVLHGIHRLSPHGLLWSSLSTCTATEATSWLGGRMVYGWSRVGPNWETLECSAPLQLAHDSTERIDDELLSRWCELTGAAAVEIGDTPGGVQARVVHSIINEAATALKEQLCSPVDLDAAMKLGVNYPDGPLHWANQLGLETVVSTMECLYRNYREERYRPAPLLRGMAMAQVSFQVKE